MAKIKHFEKMSSISSSFKNGILFEVRVQSSDYLHWAKWSRPTTNQLRKLLKCAQTGAPIPERLIGDDHTDVVTFVIYEKQHRPHSMARMHIFRCNEAWHFMLLPHYSNPLGLLQAEQS